MSSNNNGNPIQNFQDQVSQVTKSVPSLKELIKASVKNTNLLLYNLETKKNVIDTQVNSFASSRLVPIMEKAKSIIQRAVILYERREYYGPQIVAGSALAVGSLVTLRRGRIPGVFTAAATGAGAYGGIYGAPKMS